MSSAFCELLDGVRPFKVGPDYIAKRLDARSAVLALPDPRGVERSAARIPDVPVEVILSTGAEIPQCIARLFDRSEHKDFFLKNPDFIFEGLCLNGRGLPVTTFVHKGCLDKFGEGDEAVEAVFWHEYIHGAEGIYACGDTYVRTRNPWSFELQTLLSDLDVASAGGENPVLNPKNPASDYYRYLLRGLDVQQNVSELFATVGEMVLSHVRSGGALPRRKKDFSKFLVSRLPKGPAENFSRDWTWESKRFFQIYNAYGPEPQEALHAYLPEAVERIGEMYGCSPLMRLSRSEPRYPRLSRNAHSPG
ncbi:MAG: hypothetical protein PHE27_01105 [Alphaproteobacteria bacterium]|nr:hypothetical protein [Alphaproteobacteria bacterium]